MKKFFKIVLFVIFIALFAGTLYYLWQKSQKEPIVYSTVSPFKTTIIKKTVATGSVMPKKEIEIKPQVSGIITKLFVEAGQRVNEGDLIAKIAIVPNMVNLNNAESRLSRARISFNNSQLEYNRQKGLFEKGVISKSAFQQVEYAYLNAKEELNSSENNLDLIRKGATKEEGQSSNTLVRSTITGMVLDVPVEEGFSVIETNNFNAGTTIATVADMAKMIFKGKIDESEVGKIKVGMPLILHIGAIENQTFSAVLKYISPKGVKENNAIQFDIKADVRLVDSVFVRAGYSANADIVLNKVDSVMAISESLLQFEQGKAFVEVETQDGQFERRDMVTGLSDGLNIEIKSGLEYSDKIKVWNKF